jgi:hypothetical protein
MDEEHAGPKCRIPNCSRNASTEGLCSIHFLYRRG